MTLRDEDKIIHSIARWLTGTKPKYGRFYYFEKYKRISKKVKERLGAYRSSKVCPFCSVPIKHRGSLVVHLLLKHHHELRQIIEE